MINQKKIFKFFRKLNRDDILALASQLAYSLLLSFFPFIIFLLTLLGYIPIESTSVLNSLKTILPNTVFELIYTTIIEIFDSTNGNLLSISAIITIWASSTGISAIIRGLNKAYRVKERRSFISVKLMSILCTFGLALLIIFAFILLVLGNLIGIKVTLWLNLPWQLNLLWDLLRYLVSLFAMIFIFALIYKVTPTIRLTFIQVLPGAIFTTVGWILSSILFSYYVNNFNNYSRLYGGIGAVIALLLWLYISSLIILIGGEINASLNKAELNL
ncbi:YihY/virulence factor BrkB family protein [Clostridium sp. DL1XJH146]